MSARAELDWNMNFETTTFEKKFLWRREEGHTKKKNWSNWLERTFGQRILKKVCPSMRLNYQHSDQN